MKMQKIFFILIMLFHLIEVSSQEGHKYKVTSIDSTTNNYLISLKRLGDKYLLVSVKSDTLCTNFNEIKVNRRYKIKLIESTFKSQFPIDKLGLVNIENKVVWRKGDNFDIFLTDDILGLYYKPKNKKCRKRGETSN